MMTSLNLESLDFTKKHKNLDIWRMKHYFFFKLKKIINYSSRATLLQNIVL